MEAVITEIAGTGEGREEGVGGRETKGKVSRAEKSGGIGKVGGIRGEEMSRVAEEVGDNLEQEDNTGGELVSGEGRKIGGASRKDVRVWNASWGHYRRG